MPKGRDAGRAGHPAEPPRDCPACPRLVAYRHDNQALEPDWWNGAVASFGDPEPRLLVVGLAPGRMGANRTGRPFTGDYAGLVLYPALLHHGLADGRFAPETFMTKGDDGLRLRGALITNAVRCAPPENKPTGAEAAQCRPFLAALLNSLARLRAVLTLGRVAHDNTLRALGLTLKAAPFSHGATAEIAGPHGPLTLIASYHTSRYNMNTGRLTEAMFDTVMGQARAAAFPEGAPVISAPATETEIATKA